MNRRNFLTVLASATSLLTYRRSLANQLSPSMLRLERNSFLPIGQWVDEYVELWNNSSTEFPTFFDKTYTTKQQRQTEQSVKNFARRIHGQLSDIESSPQLKNQVMIEGRTKIGNMFGLNLDGMDFLAATGMLSCFADYLEIVKQRDPSITPEDIFQAGRNIATALTIQHMAGDKAKLTAAIYGYSMLYPYTDNLLDEPNISNFEKMNFANRFGQRLAGEISSRGHADAYERRIFPMVDYIESVWPRERYPAVYDSLLAIHDMQMKSLTQQKRLGTQVDAQNILKLSIEKGGTSVLADAFLVSGNPVAEIAKFSFGYGVALQFVDDMQDVNSDFRNKSATMFTLPVHRGLLLDEEACRLMNFWHSIIEQVETIPTINKTDIPVLKKLLLNGIIYFMAESVANHPQYFSKGFADQLSSKISVSFGTLREANLEKTFLQKFRENSTETIRALRALAN